MTLPLAAVDFETFYSSDYSVADTGIHAYVRDPRFDAYLVSIATDDGYRYAGPPEKADWARIAGHHWLSHNKEFDCSIYERLIELRKVPAVRPGLWDCTANLCVYHGYPRSLKNAVKAAFDIVISKEIRDKEIKGKTWAEFGDDLRRRVLDYALDDADHCLALWKKFGPTWPEHERIISRLTYEMGARGVAVDMEALERGIKLMERVRWEAEQRIPWTGEATPLSRKALHAECAKSKVPPPKSLAQDSEEFDEWLATHGDKFPWISSIADWRRANTFLSRLEAMRTRVHGGRLRYGLMYYGGHTGRDSGAGGLNVQNQPREPIRVTEDWRLTEAKDAPRTVDMRGMLVAPQGMKLLVADFAQIEARVLPWLVRDAQTLKLAREGMSVYEIHARTSMGWTGGVLKKEDPALYHLAKARVLGLGFGCGWNKFIAFSRQALPPETFQTVFGAPVDGDRKAAFIDYVAATTRRNPTRRDALFREWERMSEGEQATWVNSWLQVSDYRAKNPKIVAFWREWDEMFRKAVGEDLHVETPGGYALHYWGVCMSEGQVHAATTKGDKPLPIHGGVGVENMTQHVARNVLMAAVVRLAAAGYRPIMRIHDELVFEIPSADAEATAKRIVDLMTANPPWAKTLPLAAEYAIVDRYTK